MARGGSNMRILYHVLRVGYIETSRAANQKGSKKQDDGLEFWVRGNKEKHFLASGLINPSG